MKEQRDAVIKFILFIVLLATCTSCGKQGAIGDYTYEVTYFNGDKDTLLVPADRSYYLDEECMKTRYNVNIACGVRKITQLNPTKL